MPKDRPPDNNSWMRRKSEFRAQLNEAERFFLNTAIKQLNGLQSIIRKQILPIFNNLKEIHSLNQTVNQDASRRKTIPIPRQNTEELQKKYAEAWKDCFFIAGQKTIPDSILNFLQKNGNDKQIEFFKELLARDALQMTDKYSSNPLDLLISIKDLQSSLEASS